MEDYGVLKIPTASLVAFQMLRYMVRIMEQFKQELDSGEPLPPIIPLLIYHGREEWCIPPKFSALVDAEESWRPYLLDFGFSVLDLGRIDNEDLSRDDLLRGGFLALKWVFQSGLSPEIVASIGKALHGDTELAQRALLYLVQACEGFDMSSIQLFTEEAFPGDADQYASQFAREMIAKGEEQGLQKGRLEGRQEGRLEGRQEGRQEGRLEGEAALLLRLLQRRFGQLPQWAENQVREADQLKLEMWSDRVLEARSLDDIFKKNEK
ncbi:MAG: Rpn family recombination-promoting nuclease/putative transposase [Magnetococcales bacterium]|nr:Rpn family recombination-promoting nuclease/putative transposase [Magnetococcales bacterium]